MLVFKAFTKYEAQFIYTLVSDVYNNHLISINYEYENSIFYIKVKKLSVSKPEPKVLNDNSKYQITNGIITGIEEIQGSEEKYVYDLETKNGRFHAGVGNLVVSNTDSAFIKFKTKKYSGKEAIKESFRLGKVCADQITKNLFKPPIKLEFEKVFFPLLLFMKKRYVGNLYETTPDKPDKLDYKGIELKRRDNAPIVKEVYKGVIDLIMERGRLGISEAIEFCKIKLKELTDSEVPLEKLTISKSLRGNYKTETLPHVILAMKLRERTGQPVVSGERIPFVYIQDPNSPIKTKVKKSERAEDPDYVRERNLRVDTIYYIDNQLRKPLCQFFSLLIDNPDTIFDEAKKEFILLHEKETMKTFFIPRKRNVNKN